jgi:hypothetical protein
VMPPNRLASIHRVNSGDLLPGDNLPSVILVASGAWQSRRWLFCGLSLFLGGGLSGGRWAVGVR